MWAEYKDLLDQIKLGLDGGEIEREDVLIRLFGDGRGGLKLMGLNFINKLKDSINLQGLCTNGDVFMQSCKIGGNLVQHNQEVKGDIFQDGQISGGVIFQSHQTAKEVEQNENEDENDFTCEAATNAIREALATSGIDCGFDFDDGLEPAAPKQAEPPKREFGTGAVRDVTEGKGRCDLLPFDCIADIGKRIETKQFDVLGRLQKFVDTGDKNILVDILVMMFPTHGEFANAMQGVAERMEVGANKYGENNWRRGVDVDAYIDSGVRHFLQWQQGLTNENHKGAFAWNILCCYWTCVHMPELNVYEKL